MPDESENWTVMEICCDTQLAFEVFVTLTDCVCQAVERILHTAYVSVGFIKLVLSAVVDQLQAHCMYMYFNLMYFILLCII